MKKCMPFFFLLLIGIFVCTCVFGHTLTSTAIGEPKDTVIREIKGVVTDSAGVPIPYTSVTLKTASANAIIAYAGTNAHGIYRLRVPENTVTSDLLLEAHCIGYKIQTRVVTGLPATIDFSLAVAATELPGVVIRSRPLLRTSGDTTSYRVADFSLPQDRVIGDIIKRLPGIAVAEDGTISYNNKPVSGIYIGGDNLLDDKYSIAANTVPSSVVDKLQVIENHQPIRVLQNKVSSDDIVLNLAIKDKARLKLMGQETMGAGLPGNYYGDINALLLKDRFKAINYCKVNNTGEDLQPELVPHNASANQQRTGDNPPVSMLSTGAVNNPGLSRQRYLFNHNSLLNINDLLKTENGTEFRINGYYLHDRQQQEYSQRTSIFLPGDTIQYTETQHNRLNPSLFHMQFTINQNNKKYWLNNAFMLDDNHSVNYSDLTSNGTPLNQVVKSHTTSFSNEFNLIRSLRSNKIIEGYSRISHFAAPETLTIKPGFNDSLFNHGNPYAQLVQSLTIPTWFTQNYISLKIPGKTGTQSFRTGFSLQSQSLVSTLNAWQSNNTVNTVSDSAVNHPGWTRKNWFAEAAYDMPTGKLRGNCTLPISLQQLDYADALYGLNKGRTGFYFNPQLNVKYQTGREDFLDLRYSYSNQTGTIDNIYQGYILKDYRTISANSTGLPFKQNQLITAGFTHRKALKLFFCSVNISFSEIKSNTIASTVYTGNMQRAILLPFPNSSSSWIMRGNISKYAFALHTTFGAGLQWQQTRSIQLQNNSVLPFYLNTEQLTISADTKLNQQLNFSYTAAATLTNSHSPGTAGQHISQIRQQIKIWYNPSTNLQIKLSGDHYFMQRQDGQEQQRQGNAGSHYFFSDAAAKYHIKKLNTDLQLEANNLFNIKTYNTLWLSTNTLTATTFQLPGRIFLLKFLFSL